jgi:hypothetical protein
VYIYFFFSKTFETSGYHLQTCLKFGLCACCSGSFFAFTNRSQICITRWSRSPQCEYVTVSTRIIIAWIYKGTCSMWPSITRSLDASESVTYGVRLKWYSFNRQMALGCLVLIILCDVASEKLDEEISGTTDVSESESEPLVIYTYSPPQSLSLQTSTSF